MDTETRTMARHDEQLPEQTRERAAVTPPVDIYENADEVMVMVDLPGVAREHVTIDLNKDRLTLTARREVPADGNAPPRFEPFDYYRAFIVPPGLDPENITAELSCGVLRVRLPKSPALKPRRIEVRAA